MTDNSPGKEDSFHHHGMDMDMVLGVKREQGGQIVQLRQQMREWQLE